MFRIHSLPYQNRYGNHQEGEIEVRQGAVEEGGDCPAEGSCQLWDVVEVTRDPPPSRHQQQTCLDLPLRGVISHTDHLGPATPNSACPIGVPHVLLVVVGVVVDVDSGHAHQEDEGGKGNPQVVGVAGQVEGVACVDGRNPNQTTPALETEIRKVTFEPYPLSLELYIF